MSTIKHLKQLSNKLYSAMNGVLIDESTCVLRKGANVKKAKRRYTIRLNRNRFKIFPPLLART